MAMAARTLSGLAYPERFYAAAAYAGFHGSDSSSVSSKFSNDVALLLYALYQQATVGPCKNPKPRGWSPVEQSKWTSWNGLGTMATTEAMRLFVKILEEEHPGWYSRVSNVAAEPFVNVEMDHFSTPASVTMKGSSVLETKIVTSENGNSSVAQDNCVVGEGSVSTYDEWITPSVSGASPRARYEHGAAVIGDKMYVYGGNHNGRYLNDIQVLDLRRWIWSKVEVKAGSEANIVAPCAGHSLIPWDRNKLISVAGHTKDPAETIRVKVFDLQTSTWSALKTYGKPPVSRGGQSVTPVGTSLVIFGGQDAKSTLLNDLHILDLETMTWDEMETSGVAPSPRSDHAAAVHAERYLLIFGGGSHASIFNDLHVLDLQTMEWSRPNQQGDIPRPRAGHSGVAVGENWFIVGGGDNKNGVSETVVLNMSTLVWSVVTTVEGSVPLASEGLSVVSSSFSGEDILVSFGGYSGRYSNKIHILKPSHKSTLQSKMIETRVPDSVSAVHNARNPARDRESEAKLNRRGETSERVLAGLKAGKQEIELSLGRERLQSVKLKQDLAEAEGRNKDLYKELQSVRGQLAAEQSRCFKLEVDVAELRQKLQAMETLQKDLEILERQKAASQQAAMSAKQRQGSGGVWGWLAGTPPPGQRSDDSS